MASSHSSAKGGSAKGSKGGGGSVKITKTMPRQTSSIDDTIISLRKAVFNDDGSDKNVCETLGAFMKYDKNGLDLDIGFSPKLDKKELKWAFELVKENMEERYDASGYGWDDEDKMRELSENGARFLVVREWPEDDSAQKGELAAFCHWRFRCVFFTSLNISHVLCLIIVFFALLTNLSTFSCALQRAR